MESCGWMEDSRDLMVIVVKMYTVIRVQILNEIVRISHCTYPWYDPTILPPIS